MKKILLILTFLSVTIISAFAQSSDEGKKYSIGAEAGLLLGKSADRYSFALGGSIKAELPASEKLFATFSVGYTSLKGKLIPWGSSILGNSYYRVNTLKAIPLKGGLKYYFSGGFFGEAQAGAVFLIETGGGTTLFAYAPGIGYSFNGGMEAGVRYEVWEKQGSNINQAALRIAYRF